MSMETSGVCPKQKYLDFSKMDNVVKDAILQFLPLETMVKSAATSKLFQKMMDDKATWMKMAKKLNITPASADTAKAEIITRLKANNYILRHFVSTSVGNEIFFKCPDPFELNENIKSTLSPSSYYVYQLETLLKKYNSDKIEHSILIKQG